MPKGQVVADGNRVASLRGEAGLTQEGLAQMAGYGLRTISKIENNRPTRPSTLGAIATVLGRRLKRAVTLTDLLNQRDGAVDGFASLGLLLAESVKVLDLRAWRPGAARGTRETYRVVLIDHLRFRLVPERLREILFHYPPTGTHLEGRSLSHPAGSDWLPAAHPQTRPLLPDHLHDGHILRVRFDRPGSNSGFDFQNQVEYVNGFPGERHDWFHTHVIYPTESLTLMLWFPEHKPFETVRGLVQAEPSEAFECSPEQPVGIPAGRFAYWRVASPLVGGTYKVEWHW